LIRIFLTDFSKSLIASIIDQRSSPEEGPVGAASGWRTGAGSWCRPGVRSCRTTRGRTLLAIVWGRRPRRPPTGSWSVVAAGSAVRLLRQGTQRLGDVRSFSGPESIPRPTAPGSGRHPQRRRVSSRMHDHPGRMRAPRGRGGDGSNGLIRHRLRRYRAPGLTEPTLPSTAIPHGDRLSPMAGALGRMSTALVLLLLFRLRLAADRQGVAVDRDLPGSPCST
jgi:hypothetical protein